MPLWGRGCPLLALAAFAFLSLEGDGLVRSRLALLSPLFCEQAWRCLRLGLFMGAVLLGSLTLLLSTRVPFPKKSLALSAHVSPWTIHFRVLDKSPVSGPERGPPSCNKWQLWWDSSSLRLTS